MTSRENTNPRRFLGVSRAYGNVALSHFGAARICVVGLGGVGSWTVEALARSGVGNLTLVDMDHVAESNINRQLQALDSTLGQPKGRALRDRIKDINPGCVVNEIDDFISIDNVSGHITQAFDFVIDCVDSFRIKAAIINHCRRNKIKLITAGGAGGQTDATLVTVADLSRAFHDPLLARTRRLLREQYGFSSNKKRRFDIACVFSHEQARYPETTAGAKSDSASGKLNCAGGLGSAVCVTATFGMVAAGHVLEKLRNRSELPATEFIG